MADVDFSIWVKVSAMGMKDGSASNTLFRFAGILAELGSHPDEELSYG